MKDKDLIVKRCIVRVNKINLWLAICITTLRKRSNVLPSRSQRKIKLKI